MGKSKSGMKPKKTCCEDRPRCTRCPLRMLAEGTLPDGYTVRHRKLVKVGTSVAGTPARDKDVKKKKAKGKKAKHG